MNKQEVEYQAHEAKALIGAKVLDVVTDICSTVDYPLPSWGFYMELADKSRVYVWVNADEEGNGPGAIEVQKDILDIPVD